MALKAFIASLEDAPENVRDMYVKTDDGFVLDLDDRDFKQKISEFRDNNISLRQKADNADALRKEYDKLKELAKNFDGLDAEKAREALAKLSEMEEKDLLDAGKLDEVVAQRTDRMRQDFEARINALTSKYEESTQRGDKFANLYSDTVIESGLQRAVADVAQVRPGAMTDILARGKGVWKVDDNGQPVPMAGKDKILYGKDGKQPVTMQEWAESLVLDAPWLFEGSAGGGSGGGKGDNAVGSRVSSTDQDSINNNIEAIAQGRVQVVSNS